MKRAILLLIGALVGSGLVAGYIAIRLSTTGLPTGDTFDKQGFILQICVLLFTGVYNTGVLGFYLLGDEGESQEIRARSKMHLLLLNGLGLFIFVAAFVFD